MRCAGTTERGSESVLLNAGASCGPVGMDRECAGAARKGEISGGGRGMNAIEADARHAQRAANIQRRLYRLRE